MEAQVISSSESAPAGQDMASPELVRSTFAICTNTRDAAAEWDRCKPWIMEAARESGESLESIENSINSGSCFFWAGEDCAAVTRLDDYPDGRTLTVIYVGGNLDSAMHSGLGELERFAAYAGCADLMVIAGEQHSSSLEGLGFKVAHVALTRPVANKTEASL